MALTGLACARRLRARAACSTQTSCGCWMCLRTATSWCSWCAAPLPGPPPAQSCGLAEHWIANQRCAAPVRAVWAVAVRVWCNKAIGWLAAVLPGVPAPVQSHCELSQGARAHSGNWWRAQTCCS